MRHPPSRLIQKKRDGGELADDEVQDLVAGVTDGSLGDAQLGAFLMAVCWRGMSVRETATLTRAMRDSGRPLDLAAIAAPKVDKHSTGGVGDKVSLPLAPLVAACGVAVPMISGRGLGHTGGTLDKLQAIPGYRTELRREEFVAVLRDCGHAMAGASAEIAPADRRMYETRDVTGTVASIPLITASILSKKLSEDLDGLVLDVKCGRAAFLTRRAEAEQLLASLVATGNELGTKTVALLTDMDRPLGRAIGNALEVAESIACLQGGGPADLRELVLALGAEMLVLAGHAATPAAARPALERALDGGAALACFRRNVERQGGDPRVVDEPGRLGRAARIVAVTAADSGFVGDVDPLRLGLAAMDLGAGRRQRTDVIDPAVGLVLERRVGDEVRQGEPLAFVHARDDAAAEQARAAVRAAFTIGERAPVPGPQVLARRS